MQSMQILRYSRGGGILIASVAEVQVLRGWRELERRGWRPRFTAKASLTA